MLACSFSQVVSGSGTRRVFTRKLLLNLHTPIESSHSSIEPPIFLLSLLVSLEKRGEKEKGACVYLSRYRSPHYVPRCRVHGGRTCVSLRRAFYVGVHRTVSDIEREKDNGIRGPRQRERDETLSKPRTLSWIEEEGLFPWKILWKTFRSASSL